MHDEVDRIIAAWREERADLQYGSLAVFSRVSRLAQHLDRVRKKEFAAHLLAGYEFDLLAALRRSGKPYALTPTELAAQTLTGSATTTSRIDRLEARGFVERRRDARDARSVRVLLTPAGLERVDNAFAGLLERERVLLAGLSPQARTAVANGLRDVLAPLDHD